MKEKWSSVHYDDVVIYRCQPEDILTERIVLKILDECDKPLKVWFEDLAEKDLWYLLVACIGDTPISICGCRKDGKVLCYLYTLKEYRNKYRGLVQIDYVPIFVENAITEKLYLTVHAYDKKHERLARAWDRLIHSGQPPEKQPYRGKWKYLGIKEYRGVDQHWYELDYKSIQQQLRIQT